MARDKLRNRILDRVLFEKSSMGGYIPREQTAEYLRARFINLPGVGMVKYAGGGSEGSQESLSAVWCAVSLLAGHLSIVSLDVFERLPDDYRRRAQDHPAYRALHDESSPGVSAVLTREALHANIELHGVGYLYPMIGKDNRLELYVFNSLDVIKNKYRGMYEVRRQGQKYLDIPFGEMIVFPAMTFDGENPLHLMSLRSRSMKLGKSYEDRATAFNENAAIPSSVVTWGDGWKTLDPKQKDAFKKTWEDLYQGVQQYGGTAFMPPGSSFTTVSLSPEQIQMIQSRQFFISDVARWYHIPITKLQEHSHATYSNVEQNNMDYIQDSLLPRAVKTESILEIALITPKKREKYYIEHNLDTLLRADYKTRMEGYTLAKQNGLICTDDMRKKENMNPAPEGQEGKTFYMPVNMMPVKFLGQAYADTGQTDENRSIEQHRRVNPMIARKVRDIGLASRRVITTAYTPLIKKAAEYAVGAEVENLKTIMNTYLEDVNNSVLADQLDNYYRDAFIKNIEAVFAPVIESYSGELSAAALDEIATQMEVDLTSFKRGYLGNMSKKWAATSRNEVQIFLDAQEVVEDAVRAFLDGIDTFFDGRIEKIARNEPINLEGGMSKATWMLAGWSYVTWATFGKSCPYCQMMDGTRIPIAQHFLKSGDSLEPENETALIPSTNIGHPGLHDGCDCGIIPG